VRVAIHRAATESLPEVIYTLQTLLVAAGYAWDIGWSDQNDLPVDISYGGPQPSGAALHIPAIGRSFRSAPDLEPAGSRDWHGMPLLLFPGEAWAAPAGSASSDAAAPSDLLFTCYWWLTGAYEHRCARDRRDNLSLPEGPMASDQLLARPIVSLAAAFVRQRLSASGIAPLVPPWSAGNTMAAFSLTHDVDYPEIIRWIEIVRVLLARGPAGIPTAVAVARGQSHFWKFSDWADFADSLGAHSTFYFMARRGSLVRYALGNPDAFYDATAPRFRRLFAELRDRGCEIGLHASYRAYESVAHLREERELIQGLAGGAPIGGRHHYWHLDPTDPHETLRRHEEAGLAYDSSLGLEFYPGFRRGTCHPFHPYLPAERRPLAITQVPPAWMDDHYDRRLVQNRIADPVASAAALIAIARKTGGVAVVDYHVRGMNEDFYPRYGVWLREFCRTHLGSDLWYATPGAIRLAFEAQERSLVARSLDRTAQAPLAIRPAD
jgi:hypothetical protein